MLYIEYRTAADKHLKTCKSILDSLDKLSVLDNTSLIVSRHKQEVLHNVYYLSGYVLESISTYSIYKHFGWNQRRSVKTFNKNFSNSCQFTFFLNRSYMFSAQSHKFQDNQFEVLRRVFSNSEIEFIDTSVVVDNNVQLLFNSWKAEVRYHGPTQSYANNTALSEVDVKNFLITTENIYNSLLQVVG